MGYGSSGAIERSRRLARRASAGCQRRMRWCCNSAHETMLTSICSRVAPPSCFTFLLTSSQCYVLTSGTTTPSATLRVTSRASVARMHRTCSSTRTPPLERPRTRRAASTSRWMARGRQWRCGRRSCAFARGGLRRTRLHTRRGSTLRRSLRRWATSSSTLSPRMRRYAEAKPLPLLSPLLSPSLCARFLAVR